MKGSKSIKELEENLDKGISLMLTLFINSLVNISAKSVHPVKITSPFIFGSTNVNCGAVHLAGLLKDKVIFLLSSIPSHSSIDLFIKSSHSSISSGSR